jgi:hypothetical protein
MKNMEYKIKMTLAVLLAISVMGFIFHPGGSSISTSSVFSDSHAPVIAIHANEDCPDAGPCGPPTPRHDILDNSIYVTKV